MPRDGELDVLRRRVAIQRRRRAGLLKRRRLLRLTLLGVAIFAALGMGFVGVVFAGYSNYLSQLPDAATLAAMEPPLDSHVYAGDARTLIATFHDPNFRHEHASLNDISQWVKEATIDVEDRHFYEHASWDLPRIVKAGWDNVTSSGPTQGASTITEQLAKISFLPSERSFDRKIKQLILGNEIEANFTKDQILEMYLNRVAYGNHAIGIESAARLYYGKPAKSLDLAEASMLAGLPQSPSEYNPLDHPPGTDVNPAAADRQKVVLDAMVTVGDITQQQADQAFAERLSFHSWSESERTVAPDFVDYVRGFLEDRYGDSYIRPGGWEIYTSLDLGKQALAEQSIHNGVQAVRDQFNARDGALVSVDPKTGRVVDLVGAWDSHDPGIGQLNMALRRVQPGSTIKVFTYSAAIASRMYTMTTPVVDAPIKLNDGSPTGYSPLNYDRHFHGVCVIKTCLGNSFNVPAVKVEASIGVPYITSLEIAAGLRSLQDADNRPAPTQFSATLGGLRYGISPLDLASGTATIAAGGVHHAVTPIVKIIDIQTGKPVYVNDPQSESRRVMPEAVAYIISQMTSNDANRVQEFGAHSDLTLPDRRVSAKTGTSDFFEDNWTVGWTPEITTAVWVGNPSPSCLKPQDRPTLASEIGRNSLYPGESVDDPFSPGDLAHYGLSPLNDHCGHLEGSTGITGAAPIWHDFMGRVLAGTPPSWYTKPPEVIERGAGDDGDFYLPGTEPAPPPPPPAVVPRAPGPIITVPVFPPPQAR